jgi:hypothetical protein
LDPPLVKVTSLNIHESYLIIGGHLALCYNTPQEQTENSSVACPQNCHKPRTDHSRTNRKQFSGMPTKLPQTKNRPFTWFKPNWHTIDLHLETKGIVVEETKMARTHYSCQYS